MTNTFARLSFILAFVCILSPIGTTDGAADNGWITLFDGKDLSAWDNGSEKEPGAGWVIEDGVVIRKERAGYMWTKERFGDFVLELEFKTTGNSGVFFRTGEPRNCVQTGFEMQVNKPSKPGKHSVGALYDALAPAKTPPPTAGTRSSSRPREVTSPSI